MKRLILAVMVIVLLGCAGCSRPRQEGCLVGAFLADRPTTSLIKKFAEDYGKSPAIILTFLDWGKYPDEEVLKVIHEQGATPMITWEPWHAETKQGIEYDAVLKGKDDAYLSAFARKLRAYEGTVFLRLAHEMNGDWYPWSAQKIGFERYQQFYRYVFNIFEKEKINNVLWVFSINAEDVPPENTYGLSYPGDRFVDYIGLDGYNWGTTRDWSRWKSFKDVFSEVYREVVADYGKPVIISEFSSTSLGGDKAQWIGEAMKEIKAMPEVKGFVLFNVGKETDWHFSAQTPSGQQLRKGISDRYFKGTPGGKE